ncbi:VLRF1 family aeRF1-type release factor [Nonomuraea sp. NPDC059194]|uniref:VLRF1 family aeRF1-type release factor n=1 Tax=Nonomuraea sp. NPDC059194 TaxID=3346764 RepID=UPI0036A7095C
MVFDQTFLRELVSMKDEVGVISLYTTADPRQEASTRPAWGIRLRNELSDMRDQVASWPDKDRRAAVLSRLEELEPDIRELVDAAESGIGRALFAAVSGREVRKISLQVSIQHCAVLEPTAYVRPLVTAMATSAPAGLVLVSRDGVRLIDYRYGVAEDVAKTAFDLDTDDWRQMRGPGPGGSKQTDSTQVDRYQRRIDDNLRRFLHGVAPEISHRATALSWADVLLIGDAALTEIVAAALHPMKVVQVDTIVDTLPAPEVAKHVAAELVATRERRDAALVARVQDAALSGGKGTLGLNQTLALLNEGRVDHLLLDENGHWSGGRGSDGYLYYDQTPQSMAIEQVPDLGESMIEAALDSGVSVTILGTEAAQPLAPHKGVAALLRW